MPCNKRAPGADEQDCSESDYGSGAVAVGRSNLWIEESLFSD